MKKIASVIGGGSSTKEAPKIVMPEPEAPAPIPDEDVVRRNQRRNVAARKKAGRAATLLADDGDGDLG